MSSVQDKRKEAQQKDLAQAAKAEKEFKASQVSGQGKSKSQFESERANILGPPEQESNFIDNTVQQLRSSRSREEAEARTLERINQRIGGYEGIQPTSQMAAAELTQLQDPKLEKFIEELKGATSFDVKDEQGKTLASFPSDTPFQDIIKFTEQRPGQETIFANLPSTTSTIFNSKEIKEFIQRNKEAEFELLDPKGNVVGVTSGQRAFHDIIRHTKETEGLGKVLPTNTKEQKQFVSDVLKEAKDYGAASINIFEDGKRVKTIGTSQAAFLLPTIIKDYNKAEKEFSLGFGPSFKISQGDVLPSNVAGPLRPKDVAIAGGPANFVKFAGESRKTTNELKTPVGSIAQNFGVEPYVPGKEFTRVLQSVGVNLAVGAAAVPSKLIETGINAIKSGQVPHPVKIIKDFATREPAKELEQRTQPFISPTPLSATIGSAFGGSPYYKGKTTPAIVEGIAAEAATFIIPGAAGPKIERAAVGISQGIKVSQVAKLTKEPGVPQGIEKLGRDVYAITRGTEQPSIVSASVSRGQSKVLENINRNEVKLVKLKSDLDVLRGRTPSKSQQQKIFNIKKNIEQTTTKLKDLKSEYNRGLEKPVTIPTAKEAEVPLTIIKFGKQPPFKKGEIIDIKPSTDPGKARDIIISGQVERQTAQFLKLNKVNDITRIGKVTSRTRDFIQGAEKFGALRTVAKGRSAPLDLVLKKEASKLQQYVTGSKKIKTLQVAEAGSKGFAKQRGFVGGQKGVGIPVGSRGLERKLSEVGLSQAKPLERTVLKKTSFDISPTQAAKGIGGSPGKAQAITKETQQTLKEVFKAQAKAQGSEQSTRPIIPSFVVGQQQTIRYPPGTKQISELEQIGLGQQYTFENTAKLYLDVTPRSKEQSKVFVTPGTSIGLDVTPKQTQKTGQKLTPFPTQNIITGLTPILTPKEKQKITPGLTTKFTPQLYVPPYTPPYVPPYRPPEPTTEIPPFGLPFGIPRALFYSGGFGGKSSKRGFSATFESSDIGIKFLHDQPVVKFGSTSKVFKAFEAADKRAIARFGGGRKRKSSKKRRKKS